MDVDASQRRPGGGRCGSDARAGRRRLMEKPTELHASKEPEAAQSNVFQINAIRSYEHGLVFPRPLGAPWPRQVDWRAYLRKTAD